MAAFRVVGSYLIFMLPRDGPLDGRQIDEAIPIVMFGVLGGLIGACLVGPMMRRWVLERDADAPTGGGASDDSRPA